MPGIHRPPMPSPMAGVGRVGVPGELVVHHERRRHVLRGASCSENKRRNRSARGRGEEAGTHALDGRMRAVRFSV
jgi:hypothetical protein